jgi:hypothetical protein
VNVLEKCPTEEQHSVVRFLWTKGLSAKDVHKEMFPIYDAKHLLRKAAHNWVEKFPQGHMKVVTEATVQQVEV